MISTHQDRLNTIDKVRHAGIKVCSGGILGLGESRRNGAAMIAQLLSATGLRTDQQPRRHSRHPLAEKEKIDNFEFVRTIAAARITMPKSWVRLSAGREVMSEEMRAMCFFARGQLDLLLRKTADHQG